VLGLEEVLKLLAALDRLIVSRVVEARHGNVLLLLSAFLEVVVRSAYARVR
jgi:hypothetical protein